VNYYLGAAAIATLWFTIKVLEGDAKLNKLEKADEGEQG
jgi:hypothetical protein